MKRYKEVLLISEDEGDRHILTEAFKIVRPDCCAISVDCANCGLDYLTNLNKLLPDIIFLDTNMNAMDGKECLRKIRSLAHLKHVPVILYTTSVVEVNTDHFIENGKDTSLTDKTPFNMLCEDLEMVI